MENKKQNIASASDIKKDNITMPLNLFKERKLSMLETIVLFLKNKGLPNKDIAKFLNRDQKTISCVLCRIKSKSSKNTQKQKPKVSSHLAKNQIKETKKFKPRL